MKWGAYRGPKVVWAALWQGLLRGARVREW